MIEIEKMGKPAVTIVSGRFEEDAIASARAFMSDLHLADSGFLYSPQS